MRRRGYFTFVFILFMAAICLAQEKPLLIDNFEEVVLGGPEANIDFGSGNGSGLEVAVSADIKESGKQSLLLKFDAVSGGYMWAARGKGLDVNKIGWVIQPEEIPWEKYQAISFYLYGTDSKVNVALDIKDNGSEIWRFTVKDDFGGWKQAICPFDGFFMRDDWQPDGADKNGKIDFPIKSYQFEPLPESKGTLYFDQVELITK